VTLLRKLDSKCVPFGLHAVAGATGRASRLSDATTAGGPGFYVDLFLCTDGARASKTAAAAAVAVSAKAQCTVM